MSDIPSAAQVSTADQATDDVVVPHPFAVLPEPVRPEDVVPLAEVTPAPDPDGGRNPEVDYLLRYI